MTLLRLWLFVLLLGASATAQEVLLNDFSAINSLDPAQGWVSPGAPYLLTDFSVVSGTFKQVAFGNSWAYADNTSVAGGGNLTVQFTVGSFSEFTGEISVAFYTTDGYVTIEVLNDGSWYLTNNIAGDWTSSAPGALTTGDIVRLSGSPTGGVTLTKNGSPVALGGMDTSFSGTITQLEVGIRSEVVALESFYGLKVYQIPSVVAAQPMIFVTT